MQGKPDARDITLFLGGDVMTGRGIDQVLPKPGNPRIFESWMKSALDYVELAGNTGGRIPRPADFDYIWGDALPILDRIKPEARLVNLETAVTTGEQPAPKGINYRMSPGNAPVLSAAGIDCCVLANNHVLDWGVPGLVETMRTLAEIDITTVGAGGDREHAARPAALPVPGGRVLVFAFCTASAGAPHSWAAGRQRPGINYLHKLDSDTAVGIGAQVDAQRRKSDVVVVSIHWGGNWGYDIPEAHRDFAHCLVEEAGVDIVWGHSSHHPMGMEVYGDRLILYGCGDLINDYEGIGGYRQFRSELVLMYLPRIGMHDGALRSLRLVPMRIKDFRLQRATPAESQWLLDMLNREGAYNDTRVQVDADGTLALRRAEEPCFLPG